MTVEKLERVMWRLRAKAKFKHKVTIHELELAIMHEIGTDRRTYYLNKKALIKLGWITTKGPKWLILTGTDLTGDD